MQKLSTAKNCYLSILYAILILIASDVIAATQRADNWLDEPINISFQNEPLSKVLKQISEQTGISIAYDQQLANEKVTGNYQNVKTSNAITRLFKSKNISIQVNNEKKVVIVKTFGTKSFVWADTTQESGANVKGAELITDADLEKMLNGQYKVYKEQIADDNEVLDDGMTRGEIRVMHKLQYKELQKSMITDNGDLADGMTRNEIDILQKQQYIEYENDIANDKVIVTDGMTRREIRDLHKTQYEEFQTNQKNGTQLINDATTMDEIRTLHEEQYEEYQQTIHNAKKSSQ